MSSLEEGGKGYEAIWWVVKMEAVYVEEKEYMQVGRPIGGDRGKRCEGGEIGMVTGNEA
jgi:hypothetical protein